MVSLIPYLIAPIILGAMIYGTTQVVSRYGDGKPVTTVEQDHVSVTTTFSPFLSVILETSTLTAIVTPTATPVIEVTVETKETPLPNSEKEGKKEGSEAKNVGDTPKKTDLETTNESQIDLSKEPHKEGEQEEDMQPVQGRESKETYFNPTATPSADTIQPSPEPTTLKVDDKASNSTSQETKDNDGDENDDEEEEEEDDDDNDEKEEEEEEDDATENNKGDSDHDHTEVEKNNQKSFDINVEQGNNQEEFAKRSSMPQHHHHHCHRHPKHSHNQQLERRSADNIHSQNVFEAEPKDLDPESLPGSSPDSESAAESDPSLKIMETLVDKLVEEQTASLEAALTKVAQDLVESEEFDQFEQVAESLAIFASENVKGVEQHGSSGPSGVLRLSMFTLIVNELMPPILLQARADLRNLIIWLCSPPSSSVHIDGTDKNGDDTEVRKALAADARALFNCGTDLDIKDIWDSRVGQLAMECLKVHWKIFTNELMNLAWERVDEGKELLIDELRNAIGLPTSAGSILNNIPYLRVPHQDQPSESKEPEKQPDAKEEVPKAATTADQISKDERRTPNRQPNPSSQSRQYRLPPPPSPPPPQPPQPPPPLVAAALATVAAALATVAAALATVAAALATQTSAPSNQANSTTTGTFLDWFIGGLIDGVKGVLNENREAALDTKLNSLTKDAILRKEDGLKENYKSIGGEDSAEDEVYISDQNPANMCAWMKAKVTMALEGV
ncbi:hypothetical protein BGX26_003491 [Mortierella sp. AD094]|nr:hypothetical protein BGX26_003491 [Mortierella sp. AD094]